MCYRIVSLDGGGVAGVVLIGVLERIEDEFPGFLEEVDLLAGTSTGAIVAVGVAFGVPLSDLRELYTQYGHDIFSKRFFGGMWRSDYDNRGLHGALSDVFGDARVGQLKKRILVPAFDLDAGRGEDRRWRAKFFDNFAEGEPDKQCRLVDVLMATTAAPTYFPSWNGYVDGGVVLNNPSMAAIAQVMDPNVMAGKVALRDIRLLSVGTGQATEYIEGERHDWGALHWARRILPLLFTGIIDVPDYQSRALLGERYHRTQPMYRKDEDAPAMDDADAIPELLDKAGEHDLSGVSDWIKQYWMHDKE